jgi:plasmid stabilization system protein ParE
MDFKVVWSLEAVEDLESITEYIERDSVFYAQAVATNILKVSRSLGNFPLGTVAK